MQNAHTDARFDAMRAWLGTLDTSLNLQLDSLCPASSDAGFRRYFRVLTAEGKSFIAMDAPPEKENNEAFDAFDGLMERGRFERAGDSREKSGRGLHVVERSWNPDVFGCSQ